MSGAPRLAIDPILAWDALRAADGSIEIAASALGLTPRALLELVRVAPALRRHASGVRPRVAPREDDLG